MVCPERLLRGLRPLVLRFAPDRRRYAPASNLAEDGQVVELSLLSAGRSNHNVEPALTTKGSQAWKTMVRPERFELPAKYLFYIDKYFINLLHIACTDM